MAIFRVAFSDLSFTKSLTRTHCVLAIAEMREYEFTPRFMRPFPSDTHMTYTPINVIRGKFDNATRAQS